MNPMCYQCSYAGRGKRATVRLLCQCGSPHSAIYLCRTCLSDHSEIRQTFINTYKSTVLEDECAECEE